MSIVNSRTNFPVRASHYAQSFREPDASPARHAELNIAALAQQQQQQQYGAYEQQQQQYQSSGQSRPSSAGIRSHGAVAVGPTLVPSTHYRPPSGTSLNKVPHSARARDQILRDQHETRERLRAKALDRRIKDAVVAQDMTIRAGSVAGSRPRSKSAVRSGSATAARHHAQQLQREQAYLTQRDIETMSQPYQSHSRPQSASAFRGPQAFAPQGMPIPVPAPVAQVRPQSAQQPMQWGRAYEPADRPGQLVSSSTQSRLSAQALADQPVAGLSSGNNAGSNLASILGGGHEYVAFGNRNAPSAATRVQLAERSPLPNKTLAVGGPGQQGQGQGQAQPRYAPYATTAVDLTASLPRRFNDDAGALVVRDDLSLEPRHAPASLGFGKAHSGYREYVSKPASASRPAEVPAVLVDPFAASANILSWASDGIERGGSRAEILARQQRDTWARTSGDYGGGATATATGTGTARTAQGKLDARALPVAGATQPRHEPLQLAWDASAAVSSSSGHVHGPGCGHHHGQSNGSSSNLSSPSHAGQSQRATPNLAASSLGYGKKHAAYKEHVLIPSAHPSRLQ